jgi:hypothetical protein
VINWGEPKAIPLGKLRFQNKTHSGLARGQFQVFPCLPSGGFSGKFTMDFNKKHKNSKRKGENIIAFEQKPELFTKSGRER